MKLGIVGLPNVGKSTLFNAITKAGAEASNYPFCTIDPNVGVVAVPDARLDKLAEMYATKSKVPTLVEFVDIAGLVKGASQGEGLGNQFLAHIRETAAIAEVVRCFEDKDVVHVGGKIDPLSDIEVINAELILSDLDTLVRRKEKTYKKAKGGDKDAQAEMDLIEKCKVHLESGQPVRNMPIEKEKLPLLRDFFLLTAKPVLYVANVGEKDLPAMDNEWVRAVQDYAKKEGALAMPLCAKIEAEIAELDAAEQAEFLKDLGLTEPGLHRVIHEGYRLLGLQGFYTAGEKECRSWTIKKGTVAQRAAGEIHSDIERGFIRAEIMNYDDLVRLGSEKAVKDAGLLRVEGKDYVMQDGDVVYFRFNV